MFSADHQKLIQDATLHADTVESMDRNALLDTLRTFSFARITGLVSPAQMDRTKDLLRQHFNPANDGPTTGEHHTQVRQNYQKMSIGRAQHGGVDRPRFMRVFYNPLWADDIYEMREPFRRVCAVRNILNERPLSFATDQEEEGMWTAARLHLFPRGGGFMVAHKDTVLPALYKKQNFGDYFQPVLMVTQKGKDFHKGGGFAEIQGNHVLYEDYCEQGDIVIYDTSTVHGVEDVDTNVPYRHDSIDGRISALVTLYKSLS